MKLGLIAILTPEAGLDSGNGVLYFPDASVEGIRSMIMECSAKPVNDLVDLSRLAMRRADADFSEETFNARWSDMLTTIVNLSKIEGSCR